ncbi:MAG: hypothetical protein XU15_C0004G0075 [candidate division NC10 bacterium CSP1-5]|nr:MAG: hypothetical protein XU15_C0004G0075 [candidate division NC10 bacterium CSP1-5]
MSILSGVSAYYYIIAIGLSCYYAYRGYVGNWIAMVRENEKIPVGRRTFARWEIISVYCVHDLLFHFICSIAGFLTMLVVNNLYESLVSAPSFDTGKSVLLAFSFLFGIIGVTGQLPALIQQGKLPYMR